MAGTAGAGVQVVVGCCGFPLARGAYFARFSAVEVQATFYDPPRPTTLAAWRSAAPPDFRFVLKAWQLITHPAGSPTYRRLRRALPHPPEDYGGFRPTAAVRWAWEVTREAAEALAAEAVLFQCPATFRPTEENVRHLRAFFSGIRRDGRLLAWEPRGAWPDDLVARLCSELELVHAVDPWLRSPAAPQPVRYFRLHGGPGYRHTYTDAELRRLAAEARAPGARRTYVFFNNRTMAEDAARLAALLG
jgi:uncharacterized protein YecE (DUF72 family)